MTQKAKAAAPSFALRFVRISWGRVQGAGEKLARMTIRKGFEELGIQRIYLIVRRSNPRARKLYLHCGFKDTGEDG